MPIRSLPRRTRRRHLRRLGLLVPFALLASSAPALDLYWKNPVSGLWGVGTNWTDFWSGNPYVPGTGDRAHIGGSGDALNAWTVTLDSNISVDALFSRAALDLAGHALTLASASTADGNLDLTGASLHGAGSLAANGKTTLSGTTLGVGGTLTLGGATSLDGALNTFDRSVVNNGTLTWASDPNGSRIAGAGTLTNAGVLHIDGSAYGECLVSTGFVNTGTVDSSQGNASLAFNGTTFSNSGTVRHFGLQVFCSSFTNTGLIVTRNASFNSGTNDNSGGTIRADGSFVLLGGAWQTGKLGTLQTADNGRIEFDGTLDNAGATLDLATAGITAFGSNAYFGGETATIMGGTVKNSLSLAAGSKVVFDGVVLQNGLGLDGSDATLQNGTTLGADTIRLWNSAIRFADPATSFNGVFDVRGGSRVSVGSLTLGSGAVLASGDPASSVYLSLDATGDLTNRGAIRFATPNDGATLSAPNGTFRNEGTIDSSAAVYYDFQLAPVRVGADRFVNAGTIRLGDGARAEFVGASTFDNAGGTFVLNRATLDFGGDTTLPGLGTITATSGSRARYRSGTLSLGGSALDTQGFGAGVVFSLAGGTLKGGSVVHSTNIGDGYGGLDGMTLDAAPTFRGGFTISNGLSFPGSTITLAGGGATFAGDQTFGGAIVGAGSLGFKSGTFTQLAGGLIDGTGFISPSLDLESSGGDVDLAGTVRAAGGHGAVFNAWNVTTRAGALLSADGLYTLTGALAGGNVAHGGALRATSGGWASLVGSGTWASTGSVLADGPGSAARFGGDTDLAHLGTLSATNGGRVLYASGTLDLGGAAYDLRSVGTLGAFGLQGGTLANGPLLGTGQLTRDGRGGLRNVTLDADLDLRLFDLTLSGTLATPTGALRMEGSTLNAGDLAPTSLEGFGAVNLNTTGTLSLAGPTTIHAGGYLGLSGHVENSGTMLLDNATLSPNSRAPLSLVNSGTIRATNGGTAYLHGIGPIVNSGALVADAGGQISLDMTTGWANGGAVAADGAASRVYAFGQTDHATLAQTTLTNGARLYLQGSVTAPGTTFDLATFGPSGSFGVRDGILQVATVANSDRLATDSRMILQGQSTMFDKGLRLDAGQVSAYGTVDLNGGALDLAGYSYVNVAGMRHVGPVTLDNSNAFAGMLLLDHGSDVALRNQSTFYGFAEEGSSVSVGTLTLDRGSVGTNRVSVGRLVVTGGGEFENSLSGGNMTLGSLSVASGAGVRLNTETYLTGHARLNGDASIDGTVTSSILDAYGGTVSGNGHVQNLSLHGGTVAPGHSTGAMSVDAFTMDATSRFELEIGGDAASSLFDRLTTYTTALDGTLDLSVVDGYAPTAGTWRFLAANSGLTGTFSTLHLGQGWSFGKDATGAYVSYAPVPEPATLAALGLGLAALARRRRRS